MIVNVDQENNRQGCLVFPCLILAELLFYGLTYKVQQSLNNTLANYLVSLVQITLIVSIGLFLVGLIYAIFQLRNDKPIAIINQDGFGIKGFGLIAWQDIEKIDFYIVSSTPIETIKVQVKDIDALSKKAYFSGKLRIFYSKLFGYPAIIIANIELDNYQVIRFAQQFLDKQEICKTN